MTDSIELAKVILNCLVVLGANDEELLNNLAKFSEKQDLNMLINGTNVMTFLIKSHGLKKDIVDMAKSCKSHLIREYLEEEPGSLWPLVTKYSNIKINLAGLKDRLLNANDQTKENITKPPMINKTSNSKNNTKIIPKDIEAKNKSEVEDQIKEQLKSIDDLVTYINGPSTNSSSVKGNTKNQYKKTPIKGKSFQQDNLSIEKKLHITQVDNGLEKLHIAQVDNAFEKLNITLVEKTLKEQNITLVEKTLKEQNIILVEKTLEKQNITQVDKASDKQYITLEDKAFEKPLVGKTLEEQITDIREEQAKLKDKAGNQEDEIKNLKLKNEAYETALKLKNEAYETSLKLKNEGYEIALKANEDEIKLIKLKNEAYETTLKANKDEIKANKDEIKLIKLKNEVYESDIEALKNFLYNAFLRQVTEHLFEPLWFKLMLEKPFYFEGISNHEYYEGLKKDYPTIENILRFTSKIKSCTNTVVHLKCPYSNLPVNVKSIDSFIKTCQQMINSQDLYLSKTEQVDMDELRKLMLALNNKKDELDYNQYKNVYKTVEDLVTMKYTLV
jgi:hypothetical protein